MLRATGHEFNSVWNGGCGRGARQGSRVRNTLPSTSGETCRACRNLMKDQRLPGVLNFGDELARQVDGIVNHVTSPACVPRVWRTHFLVHCSSQLLLFSSCFLASLFFANCSLLLSSNTIDCTSLCFAIDLGCSTFHLSLNPQILLVLKSVADGAPARHFAIYLLGKLLTRLAAAIATWS